MSGHFESENTQPERSVGAVLMGSGSTSSSPLPQVVLSKGQAQSLSDYSKEQLEMLFKVSIEILADRDKLIETLCECILTLQRDSMR